MYKIIICLLLAACSSSSKPVKELPQIDTSGIVRSDYPRFEDGYVKGWALSHPSRKIIIVAAHANPSVGVTRGQVYFVDNEDNKIIRHIVKVNRDRFLVDGKNLKTPYGKYDDFYLGGDIAICEINKPLPSSIKTYTFSSDVKSLKGIAVVFDQDNKRHQMGIRYDDSLAWVRGSLRSVEFRGGDSGMPWFVYEDNQWKVISHLTRGRWGEGPYYAHEYIYNELLKRIENL